MQRNFRKTLVEWKNHPLRLPLIVRGARQVGKTFAIQAFGEEEFENVVNVNFELPLNYQACFDTMDPVAIVGQIELISKQKIIPGKTLLFLDEIQQCPKALKSLRYFKELMPDLHLIAAGSLLEFVIQDEEFSFPVGRVQFARLYPLSFEEYLMARGDAALRDALYSFDLNSPPPAALHHHLLDRVKEYFIIGGMPAAILTFLKTQSFLEVKYALKALRDAFEADFGKYAQKSQHRHLKKVFEEAPRLLGDHVKYSRIDPEIPNPARDIKQAIELLRLAGLVHVISATSGGSLPLLSGLKETIFKLLFLDIGLAQQAMEVDPQFPGLMTGPLAEQFVGQEFLATSDPRLDTRLFFWTREHGAAEVDFLVSHQGVVYPVEVKAGKSGKLKSLFLFMDDKKSHFGIKISQEALGWDNHILAVPFYLTSHLPRLIEATKTKSL
jgi:predicted AAA+ superfamily ATPase